MNEVNYIQIGEGHCWICHQTYFQTHQCPIESSLTTPCNPLTCGIWYKDREDSLSNPLNQSLRDKEEIEL